MADSQVVVAGVDAGSTAVKITLYNGSRLHHWIAPSGWNPRQSAAALLHQAAGEWGVASESLTRVYGTGYGRTNMPFLTKAITEITCHAKGAAHLYQGVETVIDIGGQDAKAIRITADGKVADFIMNDKCAAGTGRFLQVMANSLGLDVAEMAEMAADKGDDTCRINAMCAVFAESEVIGLLNRGVPRPAIIAALYRSIAARTAAMAARVRPVGPVILTGGVSLHEPLRSALAAELKVPVIVPPAAVYAGSLGATLYAWEDQKKEDSSWN
mgnify:FL=1